jgi:hypothetical protein
VATSYRAACGAESLDWNFLGEVLMSSPTGQPDRVQSWNEKTGKTRAKYVSHAKSCKTRLNSLHSLNLGVYGFPANEMGRQAARLEWDIYVDNLPSEEGVVADVRRAVWPKHWSDEDAADWIPPTLSTALGGVPGPVLVASTNNNQTQVPQ